MRCNNCGKENKGKAKFCTGCGAALKARSGKKHRGVLIFIIIILIVGLITAGIFTVKYLHKENQWQKYYDAGQKFLTETKYDEAITAFTEAIKIDDKKPLAYIGRGDAYTCNADDAMEENDLENAALLYNKAVNDYRAAKDLDYAPAEKKLEAAEKSVEEVDAQLKEKEEQEKAEALFEEHRDEAVELIKFLGDPYIEFNCETSDIGEVLNDFIIGCGGVCNVDKLKEYYGVDSFENYYPSVEKHDPLNKFLYEYDVPDGETIDWYGYDVHDGEKVDWVIQNVFNMTPDHSVTYKWEYDGRSEDLLYYYNGKYYMMHEGWGGGSGMESVNIDEVQSLGDDQYLLKYSGSDWTEERCSGQVKLKAKTIDGKFYWTFLSIS